MFNTDNQVTRDITETSVTTSDRGLVAELKPHMNPVNNTRKGSFSSYSCYTLADEDKCMKFESDEERRHYILNMGVQRHSTMEHATPRSLLTTLISSSNVKPKTYSFGENDIMPSSVISENQVEDGKTICYSLLNPVNHWGAPSIPRNKDWFMLHLIGGRGESGVTGRGRGATYIQRIKGVCATVPIKGPQRTMQDIARSVNVLLSDVEKILLYTSQVTTIVDSTIDALRIAETKIGDITLVHSTPTVVDTATATGVDVSAICSREEKIIKELSLVLKHLLDSSVERVFGLQKPYTGMRETAGQCLVDAENTMKLVELLETQLDEKKEDTEIRVLKQKLLQSEMKRAVTKRKLLEHQVVARFRQNAKASKDNRALLAKAEAETRRRDRLIGLPVEGVCTQPFENEVSSPNDHSIKHASTAHTSSSHIVVPPEQVVMTIAAADVCLIKEVFTPHISSLVMEVFAECIGLLLSHHRVCTVLRSDPTSGLYMIAFHSPSDATTFASQIQYVLNAAPWPWDLLQWHTPFALSGHGSPTDSANSIYDNSHRRSGSVSNNFYFPWGVVRREDVPIIVSQEDTRHMYEPSLTYCKMLQDFQARFGGDIFDCDIGTNNSINTSGRSALFTRPIDLLGGSTVLNVLHNLSKRFYHGQTLIPTIFQQHGVIGPSTSKSKRGTLSGATDTGFEKQQSGTTSNGLKRSVPFSTSAGDFNPLNLATLPPDLLAFSGILFRGVRARIGIDYGTFVVEQASYCCVSTTSKADGAEGAGKHSLKVGTSIPVGSVYGHTLMKSSFLAVAVARPGEVVLSQRFVNRCYGRDKVTIKTINKGPHPLSMDPNRVLVVPMSLRSPVSSSSGIGECNDCSRTAPMCALGHFLSSSRGGDVVRGSNSSACDATCTIDRKSNMNVVDDIPRSSRSTSPTQAIIYSSHQILTHDDGDFGSNEVCDSSSLAPCPQGQPKRDHGTVLFDSDDEFIFSFIPKPFLRRAHFFLLSASGPGSSKCPVGSGRPASLQNPLWFLPFPAFPTSSLHFMEMANLVDSAGQEEFSPSCHSSNYSCNTVMIAQQRKIMINEVAQALASRPLSMREQLGAATTAASSLYHLASTCISAASTVQRKLCLARMRLEAVEQMALEKHDMSLFDQAVCFIEGACRAIRLSSSSSPYSCDSIPFVHLWDDWKTRLITEGWDIGSSYPLKLLLSPYSHLIQQALSTVFSAATSVSFSTGGRGDEYTLLEMSTTDKNAWITYFRGPETLSPYSVPSPADVLSRVSPILHHEDSKGASYRLETPLINKGTYGRTCMLPGLTASRQLVYTIIAISVSERLHRYEAQVSHMEYFCVGRTQDSSNVYRHATGSVTTQPPPSPREKSNILRNLISEIDGLIEECHLFYPQQVSISFSPQRTYDARLLHHASILPAVIGMISQYLSEQLELYQSSIVDFSTHSYSNMPLPSGNIFPFQWNLRATQSAIRVNSRRALFIPPHATNTEMESYIVRLLHNLWNCKTYASVSVPPRQPLVSSSTSDIQKVNPPTTYTVGRNSAVSESSLENCGKIETKISESSLTGSLPDRSERCGVIVLETFDPEHQDQQADIIERRALYQNFNYYDPSSSSIFPPPPPQAVSLSVLIRYMIALDTVSLAIEDEPFSAHRESVRACGAIVGYLLERSHAMNILSEMSTEQSSVFQRDEDLLTTAVSTKMDSNPNAVGVTVKGFPSDTSLSPPHYAGHPNYTSRRYVTTAVTRQFSPSFDVIQPYSQFEKSPTIAIQARIFKNCTTKSFEWYPVSTGRRSAIPCRSVPSHSSPLAYTISHKETGNLFTVFVISIGLSPAIRGAQDIATTSYSQKLELLFPQSFAMTMRGTNTQTQQQLYAEANQYWVQAQQRVLYDAASHYREYQSSLLQVAPFSFIPCLDVGTTGKYCPRSVMSTSSPTCNKISTCPFSIQYEELQLYAIYPFSAIYRDYTHITASAINDNATTVTDAQWEGTKVKGQGDDRESMTVKSATTLLPISRLLPVLPPLKFMRGDNNSIYNGIRERVLDNTSEKEGRAIPDNNPSTAPSSPYMPQNQGSKTTADNSMKEDCHHLFMTSNRRTFPEIEKWFLQLAIAVSAPQSISSPSLLVNKSSPAGASGTYWGHFGASDVFFAVPQDVVDENERMTIKKNEFSTEKSNISEVASIHDRRSEMCGVRNRDVFLHPGAAISALSRCYSYPSSSFEQYDSTTPSHEIVQLPIDILETTPPEIFLSHSSNLGELTNVVLSGLWHSVCGTGYSPKTAGSPQNSLFPSTPSAVAAGDVFRLGCVFWQILTGVTPLRSFLKCGGSLTGTLTSATKYRSPNMSHISGEEFKKSHSPATAEKAAGIDTEGANVVSILYSDMYRYYNNCRLLGHSHLFGGNTRGLVLRYLRVSMLVCSSQGLGGNLSDPLHTSMAPLDRVRGDRIGNSNRGILSTYDVDSLWSAPEYNPVVDGCRSERNINGTGNAIQAKQMKNTTSRSNEQPSDPPFVSHHPQQILEMESLALLSDLLSRMLCLWPEDRITIQGVISHPFFDLVPRRTVSSSSEALTSPIHNNPAKGTPVVTPYTYELSAARYIDVTSGEEQDIAYCSGRRPVSCEYHPSIGVLLNGDVGHNTRNNACNTRVVRGNRTTFIGNDDAACEDGLFIVLSRGFELRPARQWAAESQIDSNVDNDDGSSASHSSSCKEAHCRHRSSRLHKTELDTQSASCRCCSRCAPLSGYSFISVKYHVVCRNRSEAAWDIICNDYLKKNGIVSVSETIHDSPSVTPFSLQSPIIARIMSEWLKYHKFTNDASSNDDRVNTSSISSTFYTSKGHTLADEIPESYLWAMGKKNVKR